MPIFRYMLITVLLGFITLNAKSLRVEVQELVNNPTKYKIIDTRGASAYLKSHIQNALNFPVNLTYEQQDVNGKIAQPAKIQKIARKLGLKIDDNIIIYDDGAFFDSARLFWALEVYGFLNVKLLNGGYSQWIKANHKTTTIVQKVTPSDYIATVNSKRLATKFTTQIATRNPNQVILDARGIRAYDGEISSAKRYGHILHAKYFPASHNIDYTNNEIKLKSNTDLQKIYSKIQKNTKVIVYCAVGKISATNYFALRELGYDVSNYDASWKEWGNDSSLPIAEPKQ